MSNINANDLRELKKLLDEGIITQEEFNKKKTEFLDEDIETSNDFSPQSKNNIKNQSSNTNKTHNNINDSENQDDCYNERKEDEEKKYSKSTAIVIVAIVAIIAIYAIYMSNKNKENQDLESKQATEQSQNIEANQNENSTDDWKNFDNKSWSDFKDINQKYNDLKNTVNDTSSPQREDIINKAKQYFYDKENSLNYGKNNDQNKYLNSIKNVCQQAKSVCDDAVNSSSSDSELSNIKDKLAGIEDEISNIANKRPDLLKKAGYTEEEIKDIVEKIKTDLGIN